MIARRTASLLFGLGLMLGAGSVRAAAPFASENLFYMTNSLDSFESFKANVDQISIIVPAAYHIDEYGTVYGGVDPRVLRIAAAHHVVVMPIIASFDQKALHAFFGNPKAEARAIGIMLYDARHYHYYGWQFDFENVHMTDRDAYTAFYKQAAKAMHDHGLKISMAVVKSELPVPSLDHSGYSRFLYESWKGAFDLRKLAKIGDFLSFMSYSQNNSLTPPGPVAGVPWMQQMAAYLTSLGIDPHAISFGIPVYSDYWYASSDDKTGPRSTSKGKSYGEVRDLLDRYQLKPQWMTPEDVDYAYWPGPNGVFRWLFIENARSFSEKLKVIRQYHFRGFSVWVLGDEDPGIWKVLRQRTKTIHYQEPVWLH